MKSHIVSMPGTEDLVLEERERLIRLSDRNIFRSLLDSRRTVSPVMDGAMKGDYVLLSVTDGDGREERFHVEVGARPYSVLTPLVMGHCGGDEYSVFFRGSVCAFRILSVSRVSEYPLTDEAMAELGIEGVDSLVSYRLWWAGRNGREIASKVFHVFRQSIAGRFVSAATVVVDEEEAERWNGLQYRMLETISGGDAEGRLLAAYGRDGGSLEECRAIFSCENRKSFITSVLGLALMEKEGKMPEGEELESAFSRYAMLYGKDGSRLDSADRENALQCHANVYLYGRLEEEYLKRVRFLVKDCGEIAL